MNFKLRDNAEFWKEYCEQTQNKLNEMRDLQENLRNIANQDI
jgi:CHAD domain-containing protein